MARNNVFLIFGASGVGKTTLGRNISLFSDESISFKHYDMDSEIPFRFGHSGEEVVDYFQRVGIEKFQEDALRVVELISAISTNENEIAIIDIGAGASFGCRGLEFPQKYPCVLLTASPKYLWETREKPKKLHNNFAKFQMWQFLLPKLLHSSCHIKIDVAFLNQLELAQCVKNKIINYIDYLKNKKEAEEESE